IQEELRRRGAGFPLLPALASEQVSHRDRYVAEVDVDRTRIRALVADGAMIGEIAAHVPRPEGAPAPLLLLVEERLNQERGRENLVARRVQQVGARDVRCAGRLALAAAKAVLDHVRGAGARGRLDDQALL